MKRFCLALMLGIVVLTGVFQIRAQESTRKFVPVTDAMLEKPDPANWLMWRRTQDSWGYSPLNQINKNNVAQLRLVWTRGMVAGGSQESTPLVYDGVMYLPNTGDLIQALDAKTGDLIWDHQRPLRGTAARIATSRSMATPSSTRAWTTPSMRSMPRPASSHGKRKSSIPSKPANASSGPIIANGKIISGRQCQPGATYEGCIITAHDAKTGKELWRTSTIPKPGEPGDETWGGVPMEQRWHVGTWMVPSYDPELNLIYVGTSVTIPAPKFILGGNDNKHLYHNSTLALNADTGKIVWYYQHIVDHWDLDHPFERILVDTAVAPDAATCCGSIRRLSPANAAKCITGIPGKTGVVYTLDRQTGEFLWARPTVYQNVISKIDGATGEVTVNDEVDLYGESIKAVLSARAAPEAKTGRQARTVR